MVASMIDKLIVYNYNIGNIIKIVDTNTIVDLINSSFNKWSNH